MQRKKGDPAINLHRNKAVHANSTPIYVQQFPREKIAVPIIFCVPLVERKVRYFDMCAVHTYGLNRAFEKLPGSFIWCLVRRNAFTFVKYS